VKKKKRRKIFLLPSLLQASPFFLQPAPFPLTGTILCVVCIQKLQLEQEIPERIQRREERKKKSDRWK